MYDPTILSICGWSDPGPATTVRERVLFASILEEDDNEGVVGVLCRGHGVEGTRIADDLCSVLHDTITEHLRRKHDPEESLQLAIADAGDQAALYDGACSVTAVFVHRTTMDWHVAHIGTTAAMLFDGMPLLTSRNPAMLTLMHTLENPEERKRVFQTHPSAIAGDHLAATHDNRVHTIAVTRALGGSLFWEAGLSNVTEYVRGRLLRGQALLLATEGLYGRLDPNTLGVLYDAVDPASVIAERIRSTWKKSFNGGVFCRDVRDNASCIVIACR